MQFIKIIKNFNPKSNQEKEDKKRIMELYEKYGVLLLSRECEEAHFSSSAIVIDETKEYVLFAFHNIYKSWAWLGGHVDLNPNFYEIAIKEIKEESSINSIVPYSKDIISIEILPVKEHIKNDKLVKDHLHLNVSYVFIGNREEKISNKPDENSEVKWLKISELEKYCSGLNMIPIYKKILDRIK